MTLLPRIKPTCARCGKPREGIRHVCVSSSNRKATTKLKADWGRCPSCRKPTTFMGLGHVCKSKRGDFGRRKKAHAKQAKATARRTSTGKPQHLYQSCNDEGCQRTACQAYKLGIRIGREEGYDEGFSAGIDACPREHK